MAPYMSRVRIGGADFLTTASNIDSRLSKLNIETFCIIGYSLEESAKPVLGLVRCGLAES